MNQEAPNKIPYIPSPHKRYEISGDEFSRRRIKSLRDIQHELQAELPIPISISIFGSLVKGKVLTSETAQNADIDFDLKFNEEALLALPEEERLKLERKFNIRELGSFSMTEVLKDLVTEKLNKFKDKLSLKEIPKEHVFVTPINSRSIEDAFSDLRTSLYFTLSIGSAVKNIGTSF